MRRELAEKKALLSEKLASAEKEKREEKFVMHPATFLEKDRWKDYCFEKTV